MEHVSIRDIGLPTSARILNRCQRPDALEVSAVGVGELDTRKNSAGLRKFTPNGTKKMQAPSLRKCQQQTRIK